MSIIFLLVIAGKDIKIKNNKQKNFNIYKRIINFAKKI